MFYETACGCFGERFLVFILLSAFFFQRPTSFKVPFLPFLTLSCPFLPFLLSRITALRYATFVIRRLSKAVKLQNNPYYARPFLLHKGAYVNKFTGPFVQQKPLFRVA